jgi:tripartite-type tricarboxylate transporter receptor subunit TctC
LRLLACLLAAVALAQGAAAQEYPSRPVKLVVGFPAGGGADLVARQIAAQLTEQLGKPVTVENLPGAGGTTATEAVARAEPDGYTLLVANPAVMAINPTLYPAMKVDTVKDLAPVARVVATPLLGIVPAELPARNIQELVALTKANPQAYRYGSGGAGNINQVGVELFKVKSGAVLTHAPGKSSSAAIEDLAAGKVQFMIDGAHTVGKHIRAGKLRVLVAFHDRRIATMPEVPTAAEAGLPADLLVSSWFGLVAPARTPRPVIEALQRELERALQVPKFRDSMLAQGTEPAFLDAASFRDFISSERQRWSEIIRISGTGGPAAAAPAR